MTGLFAKGNMNVNTRHEAQYTIILPMRISLLILCFLFSFQNLSAQKGWKLKLQSVEQENKALKELVKFDSIHDTDISLKKELNEILQQLHQNAFLAASVDSLEIQDSTYTAHLYIGEAYKWAALRNGNVEDAFLSQVGFKEKLYQRKPFYYKEVVELQDKLLSYAENNGYPFAKVWLDSIRIDSNRIAASIWMDKGNLIFFDNVNVEGSAKISKRYLENYLGLKEGALYDESKILKVKNRLLELPFVEEERNVQVTFMNDEAKANLFLKNKQASRFDFLIGFLPQNQETGKLLLTGEAGLDLQNPFGTGKRIRIHWESLRPATQELELEFEYPYLLSLPFGLDFEMNIYKRDSSYVDLETDFGLQYLFEGSNYLKAFWNNRRTNILEINEAQIIASRQLPQNIDVSNSAFGLEYNFEKLDYRFNPRKGFALKTTGSAGIKKIRKNNNIIELQDSSDVNFQFESLYDSLQTRSFQFRLHGNFDYYIPILSRAVIKTSIQSGAIISEAPLYRNELFRIGGTHLLRGFDEESVFASLYTIGTAEFRFLIGQNSYFYVFGDYGYIQQNTFENKFKDQPLGFGAGMTFETKAGIFGLSYALGRQQGNRIDLRSAKIHLGYLNYF